MIECAGCGKPGAEVTTWWASPIGMTALTTHPGCVELATRALADQWYGGEMPKLMPEGPPIGEIEKAKLGEASAKAVREAAAKQTALRLEDRRAVPSPVEPAVPSEPRKSEDTPTSVRDRPRLKDLLEEDEW